MRDTCQGMNNNHKGKGVSNNIFFLGNWRVKKIKNLNKVVMGILMNLVIYSLVYILKTVGDRSFKQGRFVK